MKAKFIVLFLCVTTFQPPFIVGGVAQSKVVKLKANVEKKAFRNVEIPSIKLDQLSPGYYLIHLTDKEFIQFEITKDNTTRFYTMQGTALKKSSAYQCEWIVCTCNPDENPVDCDKMIEETGCKPVIDIDGKTYCIKDISIKKLNGKKIELIKMKTLRRLMSS